jgi:molybdate transport system ATP-binding protein
MPRNLSGGERRRVALARALAAKPRLLLLDEPFAGLDESLRREAMSLLHHVRSRFKTPMILVSHMAEEIIGLTDWAIRLEQGAIHACGASASVLRGGETHIDNYLVGELIAPGRLVVEGVELSVAFAGDLRAPGAQADQPAKRGPIRVACFAHDIMLAKRRPEEISARNVLPITIVDSTAAGDAVLLTVSQPRLRVIVTPQAATSLDLAPGRAAFAIIKATSIACLGAA